MANLPQTVSIEIFGPQSLSVFNLKLHQYDIVISQIREPIIDHPRLLYIGSNAEIDQIQQCQTFVDEVIRRKIKNKIKKGV